MAVERKYHCSSCGNEEKRDRLMAKKVVFLTMGEGGKTIKSRVIAWECPTCVVKDPHWNLEKFDAPGSKYLRGQGSEQQKEVRLSG